MRKTMICVAIKGPTYEKAYQQISQAVEVADMVELRLDFFETLDLTALKSLRTHFSVPMIFVLRSVSQGGNYEGLEEHRLDDLRRLIGLEPEYVDLEYHVPSTFIEEVSSKYPDCKVILSHHNFLETPEDLEGLYQEMQKTPAFFYKIAVKAQNSLDALRLVCWAKKKDPQLIAISMSSHGQISRILGPMIGSPITYAALEEDQKSAPGQLTAKTLITQYHHRSLHPDSSLYGLIGDPVDKSISDVTHNSLMAACGFDAVYVKIQIHPSELSEFITYAKQLPFYGLSVTMPLKEFILPFLDEIDPQARDIGAVNTLLFKEGKIFGFNTDGMGALNAIEKVVEVKNKHIVMIGAGGASKAVAYEALRRGGFVTIVNRDAEKAFRVAQCLSCVGRGLDEMAACAAEEYDILINCTPVDSPIASEDILPHTVVMDIRTKPKETPFLKLAIEKDCQIVYGYQMFVEQALGQYNLWFKDRFNVVEGRNALEKKALECLSVSTAEKGSFSCSSIDGKKRSIVQEREF